MGLNNTDLAGQDYWNDSYKGFELRIAEPSDAVRQLIERHAQRFSGTAFEIGCYPGRYLAALGLLGFELNGVDQAVEMDSAFRDWLVRQGFRVGQIERGDFLRDSASEVYDLVCSFGFIEHFTNWEEVLIRHTQYVKPGGGLIVTAPNFASGIQKALHAWLDSENVRRHHLAAMRPGAWKGVLDTQGFEVIWCGYFGRFDFWVDNQKRNQIQKLGLSATKRLRRLLALLPSGKWGAPYCGIVARRRP